ncbi:MAG TPA: FG-GAP repeat protein [Phycisphaerales bacterium]|nr:FG-GAP repeat protein [Phycisphaerales bacterium]
MRAEFMGVSGLIRAAGVAIVLSAASLAVGQQLVPRAILQPWDVSAETGYGNSAAFSGRFAAVGSMTDSKVMLYVQSLNGELVQAATLADPQGRGKGFGYSLAMQGSTLVAGLPMSNACVQTDGPDYSGVVQVIDLSGYASSTSTRGYVELRHNGPDRLDSFGKSVAINGDTVIAGAPYDITLGTSSGTAYVFRKRGDVWSQEAKLVATDGRMGDLAGWAVDVHGDTAVVGAPMDSSTILFGGAVQVFTRVGSTWTHTATLEAPTPRKNGYFGVSAVVDNGRILVGETGGNRAYLFTRGAAGAWTLSKTFTGAGEFGAKVELMGSTALVSGPQNQFVNRYVFNGAQWTLAQSMKPAGVTMGGPSGQFGSSIAMSSEKSILIGARFTGAAGAATVMQLPGDGGATAGGASAVNVR